MKECYSCRKSLAANASYCYDCTAHSIGHDNVRKYEDIGGWLLFFVIWAIISVIFSLVNVFSAIGTISTLRVVAAISIPDAAFNLFRINIIISFVVIVLQIIFIAQVFSRNSRFLFFLQIAYILALLTGIFGIVAINMMDGVPGIGRLVWQLLWGVGAMLLYTLYYSSSVRVRVYMDNDEYLTKAIFTLKNKDEMFITENSKRTVPTRQSHVSTNSIADPSAQSTNFEKPSAETIFCRGCGESYSCVRDTCPYCKMLNAVNVCENCKVKYAATHESCPHCNHRDNTESLV